MAMQNKGVNSFFRQGYGQEGGTCAGDNGKTALSKEAILLGEAQSLLNQGKMHSGHGTKPNKQYDSWISRTTILAYR